LDRFWVQFGLAVISAPLLAFATSGRAFSPGSVGFGDANYWGGDAFYLLCFAVLLALYYTSRQKGRAKAGFLFQQNRAAFWFLGLGMFSGLLGIFLSFTGVALSITLLIAKTVSQPPGIAITNPNRIIRAIDVFVLLVNFNLLVAHFIGMSLSLWLSIGVSKEHLAYMTIRGQIT
jgi:hypothetical protein